MICTMCGEEVEPEGLTALGICEECQRNQDEALIGDDEEVSIGDEEEEL